MNWLKLVYLQVNTLSEWIIGIYLHEFTDNEQEISIPHEAGIENWMVMCYKSANQKIRIRTVYEIWIIKTISLARVVWPS